MNQKKYKFVFYVAIFLAFFSTTAAGWAPSFMTSGWQKARVESRFPVHPGFPKNLDLWNEKSPVVIADLNNDGNKEIIVSSYGDPRANGTTNGKVFVFDANGNAVSGFPVTVDGLIRGRLTVGDINQDGKLEIAAKVESRLKGVDPQVYIWKSDGSLLSGWPQSGICSRDDYYCGVTSITFADIDNDNKVEVIAGMDNRDLTSEDSALYNPNLYVWRSNGVLAKGAWPVEDDYNTAILGSVAVGDMDGDGKSEIVTGRDYNRLFAYDYMGDDLPGWPVYVWYPYDNNDWNDDQIGFARHPVTLADLDKDGIMEYIVAGHQRHATSNKYLTTDLLVYGIDGKRWKNWDMPATGATLLSDLSFTYQMLEAPTIGDMNGDNRPDIVISTQDGYVRAYTAEKDLLWSFNYACGKYVYASETVIGDLDGDGWNEVVFGTFDPTSTQPGIGKVWILEHDGTMEEDAPMPVAGWGVAAPPMLADLDGDNKLEIAAVTIQGMVHIWDTPGAMNLAMLPWPTARHDLNRTAAYEHPQLDLEGSRISTDPSVAGTGDTVQYTLHIDRNNIPVKEIVQIVDHLPESVKYVPGSLHASSGNVDDRQAPELKWSGTLQAKTVDITYSVVVEQIGSGSITNTATLYTQSYGEFTFHNTLIVNGKKIFFPLTEN